MEGDQTHGLENLQGIPVRVLERACRVEFWCQGEFYESYIFVLKFCSRLDTVRKSDNPVIRYISKS